LERAVLHARHVEVQVFADSHGNVLHLGERDCSVQRRHQKVIEEAPSPAVSPDLRRQLGEAAVAVARACDYVGAGTVEFLLEEGGLFWFLEMNTRLQVEHPVTEEVTMLDLVQLQLAVAAGGELDFEQDDVDMLGHAIEARIYAEDPDRDFLPQTGTVQRFVVPEGVRFDHAITEGGVVSPHYDPMLGKLIAYGRDRAEALRKMSSALEELTLHGVKTNQAWLSRVIEHPGFRAGEVTTRFLELNEESLSAPEWTVQDLAVASVIALRDGSPNTPLDRLGWRSGRNVPATLVFEHHDGTELVTSTVTVRREGAGRFAVQWGDESTLITVCGFGAGSVTVDLGGCRRSLSCSVDGDSLWFGARVLTNVTQRAAVSADGGTGSITAPLDGAVTAVFVAEGESVTKGQLLLVMEAMKMEHRMTADVDGVVTELRVTVGDQVKTRQLLAVVSEES